MAGVAVIVVVLVATTALLRMNPLASPAAASGHTRVVATFDGPLPRHWCFGVRRRAANTAKSEGPTNQPGLLESARRYRGGQGSHSQAPRTRVPRGVNRHHDSRTRSLLRHPRHPTLRCGGLSSSSSRTDTLVTVDLGFNTLDVCLRHFDIDLTCVTPRLKLLRSQLTQVMRVLTSAAGPHVSFIGVGHYNPYLSLSTKEGSKETFATNSVAALRQMNHSFAKVYGFFKVPMADVASAFHEEDLGVVRIPHKESTTVNVQYECKLTWMCAPKPYGPNIHPSDAGYAAIAKAIAVLLPPRNVNRMRYEYTELYIPTGKKGWRELSSALVDLPGEGWELLHGGAHHWADRHSSRNLGK